MPKLKKSERAKRLDCISENIRICCKVFGSEKIAFVMGVSVSTVYDRINRKSRITVDELFRLSEYIGAEPEDLTRPLKMLKGG